MEARGERALRNLLRKLGESEAGHGKTFEIRDCKTQDTRV
jgi:hypothetical protein